MHILVTGGCGFIGSNLVPVLCERGDSVRVLDNFYSSSRDSLAGYDIDLIEGDIRDVSQVEQAMAGMDAVVHLAAQCEVMTSVDNPGFDHEVNVMGTLNLLMAAHKAGIRRFVFASSVAPLGDVSIPVDETIPPRPLSPYGASKMAGEGYCSAFAGSYGLSTVALRFSNVYGPRSGHKSTVLARFIHDTLTSGQMTIYGDGNQTRDFLHVADLSAAIVCTLQAHQIEQPVIQIGSGVETSVHELALLVRTHLGITDAPIQFLPARAGEVYRSVSRIDMAKTLLNWQPNIDLETGVAETCHWFRAAMSPQ